MAALAVVFLSAVAVAAFVRFLLGYLKFRRLELSLPGPASLPLLGNALDMVGVCEDTVLSTIVAKLWGGRHSELSRATILGHMLVFVTDPDHLQEMFRRNDLLDKDRFFYGMLEPIEPGLLTLNGAEWRAHRRTFLPAFHQTVLDRYTTVFSAEALGFARRVRPGEAQDVADNLQTLVARSFLWTAVASEKGDDEVDSALPGVKLLVESVSHAFGYRCVQPWLWPARLFGMTAAGRTIYRLKAEVDAFCQDIISKRRQHLLQRKRAEGGDDDLAEKRRTLLDVLLEPGDRLSLSDQEIRGEFQIFAGAAIDTSVATLSWALKALSLKQDVQERLLEEIEHVLGKDAATRTDPICTEELKRLEYTERFIKETLRLLPAVPLIGREVKQQLKLGGHTLPAGTTLVINILGAHRHPGHWPDPLRFDPDRFLPENSEGRHPYAFVAFSAGPRNCIGSRYAMMVLKTMLATLLPRYRVDPVASEDYKEPADLPMTFGLASRMVGGVKVVFTPRVGCAA